MTVYSSYWREKYRILYGFTRAALIVAALFSCLLIGVLCFQRSALCSLRDELNAQHPTPPFAPEVQLIVPNSELHFDSELEFTPLVEAPDLDDDSEETAATTYAGMFYDERIPLDEITQGEMGYAAQLYGLDPYLVAAVVKTETEFRNVATPGDGNGYMQIMYKWHGDRMARLGVTDLMIPADNFMVGCDYLSELVAKYGLERALGAYNTGSPCVNSYAKKVMNTYNSYLET